MEVEEVRYGKLMMGFCDREGRVYDVWITFGSVHEVRAFRERKKRSGSTLYLGCNARKADEHRRRPNRWPYNGVRGKKKKGTA